jgi:hypothetical protein
MPKPLKPTFLPREEFGSFVMKQDLVGLRLNVNGPEGKKVFSPQ